MEAAIALWIGEGSYWVRPGQTVAVRDATPYRGGTWSGEHHPDLVTVSPCMCVTLRLWAGHDGERRVTDPCAAHDVPPGHEYRRMVRYEWHRGGRDHVAAATAEDAAELIAAWADRFSR